MPIVGWSSMFHFSCFIGLLCVFYHQQSIVCEFSQRGDLYDFNVGAKYSFKCVFVAI